MLQAPGTGSIKTKNQDPAAPAARLWMKQCCFCLYRCLSRRGPGRFPSPPSCRGTTGTRRGTSGRAEAWTRAPSPLLSGRNPASGSKPGKQRDRDDRTFRGEALEPSTSGPGVEKTKKKGSKDQRSRCDPSGRRGADLSRDKRSLKPLGHAVVLPDQRIFTPVSLRTGSDLWSLVCPPPPPRGFWERRQEGFPSRSTRAAAHDRWTPRQLTAASLRRRRHKASFIGMNEA